MSVADRRPHRAALRRSGGNASEADASLVDVAFDVDAGGVLDLVTERVFGTGRPLERRADVVVVGGANTDLTVAAPTLPRPGETVAEGALHTGFGGKGANQAVAARRAGAEVAFVARMGEDEHAGRYLDHLHAEGIDTGAVSRDPRAASGVALIMVDAAGHNQIAVAPGANARLRPAHLKAGMRLIHAGAVVVAELEVPVSTVEAAFAPPAAPEPQHCSTPRRSPPPRRRIPMPPAPLTPKPRACAGFPRRSSPLPTWWSSTR